jgi:hypothetical protein
MPRQKSSKELKIPDASPPAAGYTIPSVVYPNAFRLGKT